MEIWEARGIDRILEAGRTFPLVMACAGPQPNGTDRRLFVVKAMGLPEMRESGLFNENFGNYLARQLGVDTAEPVVIHLSQAFVDATHATIAGHSGLSQKGARLQAGYGAGCEYLSQGFFPIVPGGYLTDNNLMQAARIYAFDLLTQNIDRSFAPDRRPNCAHVGDRLIAYDFEMCFSFTISLFNPYKAWEVSKHGLNTPHVFHRQLRNAMQKGKADFAPFTADLNALNVADCMLAAQGLPSAWAIHAAKIETHLREIVANSGAFHQELHRSLA